MQHTKVTVEVERVKLNPMGELPPVAPEFPKKPYNRFSGNPPGGATPAEAYLSEMGVELDSEGRIVAPLIKTEPEPVLIHETVHGHEPHGEHYTNYETHEEPKKSKK